MPLPFTDLVQFIVDHFDRCENVPVPRFSSTLQAGAYGERVAAAFLRRQGYRVLYRNYRTTRGEIDLICRCKEMLVFVEVRSRAGEDFGRPAETIGSAKQESLRHAARRYLELLGREDILYRFDAVEVKLQAGTNPVCALLKDLFA